MIVSSRNVCNQNQCKKKAWNKSSHDNLINSSNISAQSMLYDSNGTIDTDVDCLKKCSLGMDNDMQHLTNSMKHSTESHRSASNATAVLTNRNANAEFQHTVLNARPAFTLALKRNRIVEKQFGESRLPFVIEAQLMKRKKTSLNCTLPVQHSSHGPKHKNFFMSCLGLLKTATQTTTCSPTKTSENSKDSAVSPPSRQEDKSPSSELKIRNNFQYYGTGKLPCPDLGKGWFFEQIVRLHGKSAGQYDVYYYSPNKVRLRSKLKLQDYLGATTSLTSFDYNCGRFFGPDEKSIGKKDALLTDKLKWSRYAKPRQTILHKKPKSEGRKPLERLKLKWCKRRRLYGSCKRKEDRLLNVKSENGFQLLSSIENEMGYKAFKHDVKRNCGGIASELLPLELITAKAWELLEDDKKAYYFSVPSSDVGTSNRLTLKPAPLHYRKSVRVERQRKRRIRCGHCKACLSVNCGKCSTCKDMKQFGGKGKMKQSCLSRRCKNKALPEETASPTPFPPSKKPKRSSSKDDPYSSHCSSLQKNGDSSSPAEHIAKTLSYHVQPLASLQSTICSVRTLSLTQAHSDALFTSTPLNHDTLHTHHHSLPPSQSLLQSRSSSIVTSRVSSTTSYHVSQSNVVSYFTPDLLNEVQPDSKATVHSVSGVNNQPQLVSSENVCSPSSKTTDDADWIAEKLIEKSFSENSSVGFEKDNILQVGRSSSIKSKTSKIITKSSAQFDFPKLNSPAAASDRSGDDSENILSQAEAKTADSSEKSPTASLRTFASVDNSPALRKTPPRTTTEDFAPVECSSNEVQLTVLNSPPLSLSKPSSNNDEADKVLNYVQSKFPVIPTSASFTSVSHLPAGRISTTSAMANSTIKRLSDDLQRFSHGLSCTSKHSSFSHVDAQNPLSGVKENLSLNPVVSGVNAFEPTTYRFLENKDREIARAWENVIHKVPFLNLPKSREAVTTSFMKSRQTSSAKAFQEPTCTKISPRPFINPSKVLNMSSPSKSFINPEVLKRKRNKNLPSSEIGMIDPYFSRCGVTAFEDTLAPQPPTTTSTIISNSAGGVQQTQSSPSPFLMREADSEKTSISKKSAAPSYFDANLSRHISSEINVKKNVKSKKPKSLSNIALKKADAVSVAHPSISTIKTSHVVRKSTNKKKSTNKIKLCNIPFF